MTFRFIPAWCAAGSMVLAQEAKEAAATRRKEQTDRCSFTAKRIKDKIKNSQDKAANKKNEIQGGAPVCPCHCHHASTHPGQIPAARQRPGSACAHVTHLHQYVVTSARKASFGSHRDSSALIVSARQQRPLLLHKDFPHTHKPRDFTTRDDVEKKHRAPEPRSSPTLKVRPQRATPSAPKAVLPRPLRTSGTSRECDLLLAQPFPLMHGTASNPWTTRDGLRWRAKACSSWLWLSRHFGQTRDARGS